MKKSISILLLLVAFFMMGCGGGSSGATVNTNNEDTSTNNEDTSTNNTNGFKYPVMFQNFDNFKSSEGFPVDRTGDIFFLQFAVPLLTTQLNISQGIGENDNLQRSSCEKGSASASGYYEDDPYEDTYGSADGSINFNTSSGIYFELVNSPDVDCTYNDFYDGYVIFDIDEFNDDTGPETTSITSTLGSSGAPLYLDFSREGYFDGSVAYIGSYNSDNYYTPSSSSLEISVPSMEIYTVDSNVSEIYTKGAYDEDDYAYYKNFTQKNTTTNGDDPDNEILSISISYEQQFEEDGEEYLIQVTRNTTRKFGVDSLIITETYKLNSSDSSKTVIGTKTTKSTDNSLTYTFTMTKDGNTETVTQSF